MLRKFKNSELRDCSKMLEKADIKIIDFDDFVFCTTEPKSIPFLRRRLLVATKITNIDDLILRLRLFTHPGKFLFTSLPEVLLLQ